MSIYSYLSQKSLKLLSSSHENQVFFYHFELIIKSSLKIITQTILHSTAHTTTNSKSLLDVPLPGPSLPRRVTSCLGSFKINYDSALSI